MSFKDLLPHAHKCIVTRFGNAHRPRSHKPHKLLVLVAEGVLLNIENHFAPFVGRKGKDRCGHKE